MQSLVPTKDETRAIETIHRSYVQKIHRLHGTLSTDGRSVDRLMLERLPHTPATPIHTHVPTICNTSNRLLKDSQSCNRQCCGLGVHLPKHVPLGCFSCAGNVKAPPCASTKKANPSDMLSLTKRSATLCHMKRGSSRSVHILCVPLESREACAALPALL